VRLRTQVQNALQAIALANGLRRGPSLWSYDGQAKIAFLPLPPHTSLRRSALQALYRHMDEEIEKLTAQVAEQAEQRLGAQLLMRRRKKFSRERAHLRECMGVLEGEEKRFKEAKKDEEETDQSEKDAGRLLTQ
jgi:hypothetical protein